MGNGKRREIGVERGRRQGRKEEDDKAGGGRNWRLTTFNCFILLLTRSCVILFFFSGCSFTPLFGCLLILYYFVKMASLFLKKN